MEIMSLEQSKALLIQMGERCLKLADDLGHGGRRLDKEQNELLKTAYLPIVSEHLNLIKVGYISGDQDLIKHSQDVLSDIMKGTQYRPRPDSSKKA
jgi:hypothetical protein